MIRCETFFSADDCSLLSADVTAAQGNEMSKDGLLLAEQAPT